MRKLRKATKDKIRYKGRGRTIPRKNSTSLTFNSFHPLNKEYRADIFLWPRFIPRKYSLFKYTYIHTYIHAYIYIYIYI